ncbi:MAG: hypothetical protein WC935_08025 [Thermoleophilia bacterium]
MAILVTQCDNVRPVIESYKNGVLGTVEKYLRNQPPSIAMTTRVFAEDIVCCFAMEMDGLLTRPTIPT